MTTSITTENGTAHATGAGEEPKATKKGRVAARGAHVAPSKGMSAQKASPLKKAAKRRKKAEKPCSAREGSKTAQLLELLTRPGGATLKNLMAATEWQAHSVRGFVSGTLGKKMGLSVASAKGKDGERTYSLRA